MGLDFPRISLSPLQWPFSNYVTWSINVPFVSRHLLSPRSVVFPRLRTRPQAICLPIPYGCAVSNNPSHSPYNSNSHEISVESAARMWMQSSRPENSCVFNRGPYQYVLGQMRNIPVRCAQISSSDSNNHPDPLDGDSTWIQRYQPVCQCRILRHIRRTSYGGLAIFSRRRQRSC